MKDSEDQSVFDFGGKKEEEKTKREEKISRSYLEDYLDEADKDPIVCELSKVKKYRGEESYYPLTKYRQDKEFLNACDAFVKSGYVLDNKFEKDEMVIKQKRRILEIKYAKLNVGMETIPLHLCTDGRINSALPEMYKSVKKKVEKYQKFYDATLASDFQTIITALTIATKIKDVSDQKYFRDILEEKLDLLTTDQQFEIENRYEKAFRAFDLSFS